MRVLFSPRPCQYLFLVFLIIVIVTCVRRYCTVVFICISLMISDVDHIFMRLLATQKMSVQVLCPFFSRVVFFFSSFILRYMSSLYILDINPLSDISFANIFFHSLGNLLVLLIAWFTVQKSFSLM